MKIILDENRDNVEFIDHGEDMVTVTKTNDTYFIGINSKFVDEIKVEKFTVRIQQLSHMKCWVCKKETDDGICKNPDCNLSSEDKAKSK